MAASSTLAMTRTLALSLPSVLAALGFGWGYWVARQPERAGFGGFLIVVTAAVQYVATALSAAQVSQAQSIAYFAALLPLVAAATMRLQGVIWSGAVGAVALVAQGAIRERFPAGSWQDLVAAYYYFTATWVVAAFAAAASERALRSHVKEELRAGAALAATREAERRYQLVAEQVSDLVSVLDEQGRFVYLSPSHERVLGLDLPSSLGRAAPELVHADDYGSVTDAFSKTLQHGSAFTVARLQAKDGDYRWFHIRFSRIDSTLAGGAVAISARDITEQQRLSEALEGTRRMESLGRLAGGVAHDFNNLLLVIRACTDLATRQLPEAHPARADLSDIVRTTERAAALTKQLLTFARRQVLPARQRSSVSGVVSELLPILERVCGKSIRLSFELAPSGSEVSANSVELEQIIMNLTSNARDAMPDGGSLTIAVRLRTLADRELAGLSPGPYVELSFKDSGVGMSPEVQARIFEPFFTTKPAGRGTGLGLATVFGLVAQLGGRINVSSVEQQGTEFRVMLPCALGETDSAATTHLPPTSKSMRVLVVDDEEVVRALIARILEASGHEVTQAASAEAALLAAKASSAQFDLILTDVVLGAADGLAVLDTLRAAHPKAGVLVMSGYSPTPERVAELSRQGAEFLAKPFGAGQLMAALERVRPSQGVVHQPRLV